MLVSFATEVPALVHSPTSEAASSETAGAAGEFSALLQGLVGEDTGEQADAQSENQQDEPKTDVAAYIAVLPGWNVFIPTTPSLPIAVAVELSADATVSLESPEDDSELSAVSGLEIEPNAGMIKAQPDEPTEATSMQTRAAAAGVSSGWTPAPHALPTPAPPVSTPSASSESKNLISAAPAAESESARMPAATDRAFAGGRQGTPVSPESSPSGATGASFEARFEPAPAPREPVRQPTPAPQEPARQPGMTSTIDWMMIREAIHQQPARTEQTPAAPGQAATSTPQAQAIPSPTVDLPEHVDAVSEPQRPPMDQPAAPAPELSTAYLRTEVLPEPKTTRTVRADARAGAPSATISTASSSSTAPTEAFRLSATADPAAARESAANDVHPARAVANVESAETSEELQQPETVMAHRSQHSESAHPALFTTREAAVAPRADAAKVEAPPPTTRVAVPDDKLDQTQTSTPLRDLTVRVPNESNEMVSVRFTQKGGTIDIGVKASQPEVAQILRRDLPELMDGLRREGFRTEVASSVAQTSQTVHSSGSSAASDQEYSREGQRHAREADEWNQNRNRKHKQPNEAENDD